MMAAAPILNAPTSNAPISNAALARAAQLLGFSVVAVALAVVSWRTVSLNLPDVGQFAGVVGSGFLGGIINPLMKVLNVSGGTVALGDASQVTKKVEVLQDDDAAALRVKRDPMWDIAVVVGAGAIIASALALAINSQHHMNAAAALTALATAFGALFLDTSKITHTPVAG
jgi:hypothetical protein